MRMRPREWAWVMVGWLLAALIPAQAQGSGACAQEQLDEAARGHCARSLYGDREYVAAARHYERLWLDTGDPKYLYNAAAAREAAGHMASAVAQWTRYSDSQGVSEAEREAIDARLDGMRARLIAVTVTVTPPEVLGPAATFWCERGTGRALESFDVPAHLVADYAAPGSFTLYLEPGAWNLRLNPASPIAAYSVTSATVLVVGDTVELPMSIAPRPVDHYAEVDHSPEQQRIDQRLPIGLGGVGAATALIGIIVVANGRPELVEKNTANYYAVGDTREWLKFIGGGSGLIGAAVGFGASAGLEMLRPTRRRHQIQLGAGAGVAAIGLVWHLATRLPFKGRSPDDTDPKCMGDACFLVKTARYQSANRGLSSSLLGAGAALMAGVGASYLLRIWLPHRRQQQRQRLGVAGLVAPRTAGLLLYGSF